MRPDKSSVSSLSQPGTTEVRLQGGLRSKLSQLLLIGAASFGTAAGTAACGPSDNGNNNNEAGSAGSAGEGGSGGTNTGGTGGTDAGGTGGIDGGAGAGGEEGGNPCDSLTYEQAMASEVFEPGQTGKVIISLGNQHPDKAYNGMELEIRDGALFVQRTRVGLEKVVYDNYDTGYSAIGDVSGLKPVAIDADRPFIDDGQNIGNCVLNRVPLSGAVLADTSKRPLMRTPEGYFTTVFRVENNSPSTLNIDFSDRTEFAVDSMTSEGMTSDYILGNSKPDVSASLTRDQQGHLVLDLAGTTDEGLGDEGVLSRLNASADGVTFAPVLGQPGKFRTTAPSNATSLNIGVQGLNHGLTDDTTLKSAEVSCEGIDCNGNGTCSGGVCECDPGFANADNDPTSDCNACDLESGLYENDYPACSPDVTPPITPTITDPCGGVNCITSQSNFTIFGNAAPDTHEIWHNIDGGPFGKLDNYTAFSTNFVYNGTLPPYTDDTFCFKAVDKAQNESGTACINIGHVPE